MTTAPKRRVQLKIDLHADDWEIAARHLREIALRIERNGPITSLCSGGWDCGYEVLGSENPDQTGDKYRDELEVWMDCDARH